LGRGGPPPPPPPPPPTHPPPPPHPPPPTPHPPPPPPPPPPPRGPPPDHPLRAPPQLWAAVDVNMVGGHLYYFAAVLVGPSLATHLFLAQARPLYPSTLRRLPHAHVRGSVRSPPVPGARAAADDVRRMCEMKQGNPRSNRNFAAESCRTLAHFRSRARAAADRLRIQHAHGLRAPRQDAARRLPHAGNSANDRCTR
jgi:hypothetical protein